MRSVILIHGVLRGMGHESECDMVAMKESSPGRAPIYSQCSVIEAPPDLPDGYYTVTFRGQTVRVLRQGGLWLPGNEILSDAA